jgi:Ran GTPase-activating protein (RanGAP) involved in mRNA processing and transport
MQVVEVDLRNQSDLIDVDGLQYYKNLARLNLSGCSAVQGDKRMKKTVSILNNVPTLVSLDVSQNKLQALEAAVLAQGIANWALTLTSLNLASNSLGVEGAKIIAAVLPKCTAILSINLLKNQIPVEQAQELVKTMQAKENLTTLCGLSREETELDFSGQYLGAGDAVLIATDIRDMGALPVLSLKANNLATKEAGKVLAEMLKDNSVLKELDLSSNAGFYGADAPGFAQKLAVGIRDSGALTSLNLAGNFLCGLNNYGQGTYDASGVTALANVIPDMRALTSLDISNQVDWQRRGGIGVEGAKHLAKALKDHAAISSVNLLLNDIGVDQARNLVGILKEHPTLKSLCGNMGNETELDMSGKMHDTGDVIMLVPEIVDNGALTSLNLASNLLKAEGAKIVIDAIKDNEALIKLDISDNHIGTEQEEGLQRICVASGINLAT